MATLKIPTIPDLSAFDIRSAGNMVYDMITKKPYISNGEAWIVFGSQSSSGGGGGGDSLGSVAISQEFPKQGQILMFDGAKWGPFGLRSQDKNTISLQSVSVQSLSCERISSTLQTEGLITGAVQCKSILLGAHTKISEEGISGLFERVGGKMILHATSVEMKQIEADKITVAEITTKKLNAKITNIAGIPVDELSTPKQGAIIQFNGNKYVSIINPSFDSITLTGNNRVAQGANIQFENRSVINTSNTNITMTGGKLALQTSILTMSHGSKIDTSEGAIEGTGNIIVKGSAGAKFQFKGGPENFAGLHVEGMRKGQLLVSSGIGEIMGHQSGIDTHVLAADSKSPNGVAWTNRLKDFTLSGTTEIQSGAVINIATGAAIKSPGNEITISDTITFHNATPGNIIEIGPSGELKDKPATILPDSWNQPGSVNDTSTEEAIKAITSLIPVDVLRAGKKYYGFFRRELPQELDGADSNAILTYLVAVAQHLLKK